MKKTNINKKNLRAYLGDFSNRLVIKIYKIIYMKQATDILKSSTVYISEQKSA